MRILVVDDEPSLCSFLVPVLTRAGFQAESVGSGAAALAAVVDRPPDLVLLDVGLPDMSGLAVCQALRRRPEYLPVILLTVLGSRADELAGFAALADDYITKPFSADTLLARVRAVLRCSGSGDPARHRRRFGDVEIDLAAKSVRRGDRPVPLTRKQFELLAFLVEHPGRVFGSLQLLGEVWGVEYDGSTATVAQHIWRLRSALEADPSRPRHLITRSGVGYLWAVDSA
ncbi:MAG: response regulator transcription factor [Mycobacteriales bacterium]